MASSITPGEWRKDSHNGFPIIVDEAGDCIATIDSRGGYADRDEREANQALIAAAPALLAACVALCDAIDDYVKREDLAVLITAYKQASEAISNATGN